jgi:hypothetical protein
MVTALFRTFPPSSVGTRCRRTYGTGWPTSSVQTSGCTGDSVTGLSTYISRIAFFVANRQFPTSSSSRMIWLSTGSKLDTLRRRLDALPLQFALVDHTPVYVEVALIGHGGSSLSQRASPQAGRGLPLEVGGA